MIQTDPLSLVFIGCFVFSGAFLVATTLLGTGHGHSGLHFHTGHLHLGGHVGGHTPGGTHGTAAHATAHAHTGDTATQGTDAAATPHVSPITHLLGGINLNEILVFLFCFGLLGYLLHNVAHAGAVLTIFAAGVLGGGAAGATNVLFMRLFGEETGRLGLDSSQMEGRIATVSLPIRAEGIGEIIFVGENGTRRSLGARSADGSAIARDAEVVIIGYVDGIAQVEAWDHFLAGAQTPSRP
jgi:hypothetical protein